nr:hypothetical protein [Tanacetum cinerariifolium]
MNFTKDAKVIDIDNQSLILINRQVETELMLEERFRDLCEKVSNFVKVIQDEVKEVERLSCKDVAKETVRLLRRVQKRELYKMTCLQMMVELLKRIKKRQLFITELEGLCPSAKRCKILECLDEDKKQDLIQLLEIRKVIFGKYRQVSRKIALIEKIKSL